jgi:hypothetical protein
MATAASDAVWDDEGMLAITARQLTLVSDAGALAQLPIHLSALALARAWIGDLAGADALIAEIDSVVAATGSRSVPGAALRLAALEGREAESAALIATVIKRDAVGTMAIYAQWAAAVLYNGLARYKDAVASARQATSSTGTSKSGSSSGSSVARTIPSATSPASSASRTVAVHYPTGRAMETSHPAGDRRLRSAVCAKADTTWRPVLVASESAPDRSSDTPAGDGVAGRILHPRTVRLA